MYNCIAGFYDLLMSDVDYVSYAKYLDKILIKYSTIKPNIVLDVGCGTGSLTCSMRDLGYSMIGCEPCQSMLSQAMGKDNTNIQYINQGMDKLDLYGTVGAAVSFLDCINHITNKKQLEKGFERVSLFLEPNGLFIFDLNTLYKFEHTYGNNVFYDFSEDIAYTWVNCYSEKTKLCKMDITYFIKNDDNLYQRYDTCNTERAYTDQEILLIAENSGFVLVDILEDLTFDKPKKQSQRKFMILKKI